MSTHLDADYLLKLAREKSQESRSELAQIVNDLFSEQAEYLSDREKRLMFNIIENLLQEVESSIRKHLSEKLANFDDIPHDLLLNLARDDIEVAYPILTTSQALIDEDLIEIIHQRTEEHLLAITLRTNISEHVSEALVKSDKEKVVLSLLKNENAAISSATMEYLVDQSKRLDTFQEPLLRRHDLRGDLAQKMFKWVSGALRQHIISRYELNSETIDHLLEEAAKEGYETSLEEPKTSGASILVGKLREQNMLNPEIMLKALLEGEAPLFFAIFSELTNLSDVLIKRIFFYKGGEGIAIACKAIDMPEINFEILFQNCRLAAPNRAEVSAGDIDKIKALYRTIQPEDARKVVELWKESSGVTAAIREVMPDL